MLHKIQATAPAYRQAGSRDCEILRPTAVHAGKTLIVVVARAPIVRAVF